MAAALIATGLTITLKNLIKGEDYYNIGDDSAYYRLTIHRNGATDLEYNSIRCKIHNGSCTVLLPSVERKNGVVVGYSQNKDDIEANYKEGDVYILDADTDLYVISYVTYTLTIDENGVDYLETNKVSCKMYNEEKSCKVVLPKYNKVGQENKGYSYRKDSLTGFVNASEEYELTQDEVLYPIFSISGRHQVLNITKTFNYLDSIIEVEKGCSESIYGEYLKYLDGIKKYTPYLLLGNKITFVVESTFDRVWGKTYVGMNYGPKNLRSVDIRCGSNSYNDYYATMVHEMAHSWDFFYANKFGENISSQSDVINLYNKYKDANNRPLREYSYSNIYEFVADMMRYYYFKYYVPRSPFSGLSYPDDMKKVLEKYICISKNNYDESKCS